MGLPAIPTRHQDSSAHRQRIAEVVNDVTSFQFDDSRVRTSAEIAAGATPVNYAFAPQPSIDARRYGWSEDADAETNASAIEQAVTVLQNILSVNAGGCITVPAGEFDCWEVLLPTYICLRGASMRGTIINYFPSGRSGYPNTFATLGSYTIIGALNYSCSIADLSILMTNKDSTGVYLMETQGAEVSRVYIEGLASAGRTSRGVVIDGGDGSSFYNHIDNVVCNHIESSYVILTTGAARATTQYFTNCAAFGDVSGVGTASKGLSVISNGRADGTVWIGGNIESCGTGMYFDSTALSMSIFGTRFEANTLDGELVAGCKPIFFFGLQTDSAYNFLDVNGVAGFYGCATVGGSRWSSQGTFSGTLITMSAATSGNITWRRMDKIVELYVPTAILGTLNGTTLKMTGLPQGLTPSVNKAVPCSHIENSGQTAMATALVKSDNTIEFFAHTVAAAVVRPSATGFVTATSTGLQAGWAIRYGLD